MNTRKRPRSTRFYALLALAMLGFMSTACLYDPITGFLPADVQAFNSLHGTKLSVQEANDACAQLNAAGDPAKCEKTVQYLNALKLAQLAKKPHINQIAEVSWYDPAGLGGQCAFGKCPPNNSMSCAHKTAPKGTVLELTAKNGRTIRCTVVDRGPYISGRAVDLFPTPAVLLGVKGPGILRDVHIVSV